MEYTVGSIADLISGKNTPNKLKVKKRNLELSTIESRDTKFTKGEPLEDTEPIKLKKRKHKTGPISGDSNMVVINPEMFSKLPNTEDAQLDSVAISNKKKVKPKKRKLDDKDDTEPTTFKKEKLEDKPKKMKKEKLGDGTKPKKIKKLDEDTSDLAAAVDKPKRKKQKTKNIDKKDNEEHKQDDTKDDKIARAERDSRTVFVGNVPVTVKKRQLLRLFGKYGHVESVRLRCIAPAEPGIPKRVAFIKKLLHPKRLTMHSYVTFSLREDALKALVANGMQYKDHHLRVQISNDTEKPDSSKAIFIGNLPFDVEDDEIWNAFASCGTILSVRVIRDAKTNMGIGIAYVNFESTDSVELALLMENVTVKKKCNTNTSLFTKEKTWPA